MDQTLPPKKRGTLRVLARFALFPLGLAAYLFIIFEEWLWERAKRAMAQLGKLPIFRTIESALASAPPWAAACAFLVPAILLFPFKLAGLYLIAHHHAAWGACVFLMAKAVGAAALARVWSLTEKSLRTIGWLSRSVDWIVEKKDRLKHWTSGLWAIRVAKSVVTRFRAKARSYASRIGGKLWAKALRKARTDIDSAPP